MFGGTSRAAFAAGRLRSNGHTAHTCCAAVRVRQLGEIPVCRRSADRPELGRWPDEFDTHCGEARIRWPNEGDGGFTLIPILRIHQQDCLSARYPIFQEHQPTVSIQRYGEGLLAKRALVVTFTTDHERHVQDDTFAASQRC